MSLVDATWYDGRGSRPRPARLGQPAPGQLRLESEGEVLDVAADAVQLSPRLGSMPRTLRWPGHGHLELADSPLLDQWLPVPSRIEAWAHWLERRRSAALGAGLATVTGVVFFFQVGLPWMANRLAPVIPAAIERTISNQALAILDKLHFEPSKLPAARQQELQAKFAKLVSGLSREGDFRLDFRSAPKIGPNAFALPDGQVLVTDELVELVASDEELLAVLAHEAGHHEQHHGMRAALQSSAVVVVAGFLFGDLSGTASLSVSIPVLLIESGFSRTHEREADEFAFKLLVDRGQSPADFATVMERLDRHFHVGGRDRDRKRDRRRDGEGDDVVDIDPDRDEGSLVGYLSTHPSSVERIEAARRAAEAAGHGRNAAGGAAATNGGDATKAGDANNAADAGKAGDAE